MTETKIYFRHSEFRAGQSKMISDILQAITSEKNILVHAPTGTGKTDASLSAAITFALDNNLKIFFLTPKTSQHKIALEVIEDINKKYDANIRAIDFVGKRNMCVDPGISQAGANFYEICRKAKEKKQCPFYENIRPINKTKREILQMLIEKMLKEKLCISHHELKEIAEEFKSLSGEPIPLCAYELAKQFAKSCDIIIADYYHVFSKGVSDSLFSELNLNLNNCILIIDEAHNLEDRMLKLLSNSLNTFHLNKAINESRELDAGNVKEFLHYLLDKLETISEKKLSREKEAIIEKDEILDSYKDNITEMITVTGEAGFKYLEKTNDARSALINVAYFLENWLQDIDAHIRLIKREQSTISIKYNALDVSAVTKPIFNSCHSAVLMSATLTPLNMYQEILGLSSDDTVINEYSSPFDPSKRLNILVTDVSTKFTQRSNDCYSKIASHITNCLNAIPGNTIVFFPSFEILSEIQPLLKSSKPMIVQPEGSTTTDFENMIIDFKKHSKMFGAVLLAVMGGKASEGIDLPNDYLIGAIIVGIPLARMELEVQAKIDYYEGKFKKGWLYAYIQPAIQKTIQSAGRVIRTHKDSGVVVFMDERYDWDNYRRCLPRDLKLKRSNAPEKEIKEFFENNK